MPVRHVGRAVVKIMLQACEVFTMFGCLDGIRAQLRCYSKVTEIEVPSTYQ